MTTVRLPLTRGKIALIDADDFEKVSELRWHALHTGHKWRVAHSVKKSKIYLHRYLLGVGPEVPVFHANGNPLDNRRANLVVDPETPGLRGSRLPRAPKRNGDGTMTVPLTKGLSAIIDEKDNDLIGRYLWHASRSNSGYYARASLGGPAHGIQMHRLILPPPDGYEIDHINGDKLDNRRCNLRVVTRSENMKAWAEKRFPR